ncbi:MAG: DUF3303 family protein [Candidatus Eremiobacteraeota bacterium]|nr:DUF3303 family protein [Candidatus Eremiobacteraeota bacterium]
MATFMVIERFKCGSLEQVGQRFLKLGRLLPADVTVVASWMAASGETCYQLMTAPSVNALMSWTCAWHDLVDFEITPVVTSDAFWASRASS